VTVVTDFFIHYPEQLRLLGQESKITIYDLAEYIVSIPPTTYLFHLKIYELRQLFNSTIFKAIAGIKGLSLET